MAYWLLKTEPAEFSYADLESAGRTVWDGVTNPLALKHMRAVRRGDRAFVYHTGREKAVVGIARVASDPRPDPRAADERIVAFDLEPDRRLPRPVTLAAIKAEPELAGFELVRLPRLSVMPVPPAVWKRLLAMAGEPAPR